MVKRWLALLSLLTLAPGVSQAAGTLTGKITDPFGRPVAGISLWAMAPSDHKGVDLPPSAVSGSDGSFSIPGLKPDRIDLYACGRGYLHEPVTVSSLGEPVHLEVRPAAMVRGQVLGPDGVPMAGVRVYARDGSWRPAFPGRHPLHEPWSPCRPPKMAESAEDGGFEIGPLPPEEYTFQTYSSGLVQKEPPFLRIDGEGGSEWIEIRLQHDGSRKGWVFDTEGVPVEWAGVTVRQKKGEPRTYLSETGGLLHFFADPGLIRFRVEAEGYEVFKGTLEIKDDETPVEFVLVLVRDESSKPAEAKP